MFKVGQKVVCIKPYDSNSKIVGLKGTILGFGVGITGVEFYEYISSHDSSACGTTGKKGHCWNFHTISNLQEYLKPAFADTEEVE